MKRGGKWYVVDRFAGMKPIGPFDTKAKASKERREINIGGDCVLVRRLDGEIVEVVS